jgi:hypothetical protein
VLNLTSLWGVCSGGGRTLRKDVWLCTVHSVRWRVLTTRTGSAQNGVLWMDDLKTTEKLHTSWQQRDFLRLLAILYNPGLFPFNVTYIACSSKICWHLFARLKMFW